MMPNATIIHDGFRLSTVNTTAPEFRVAPGRSLWSTRVIVVSVNQGVVCRLPVSNCARPVSPDRSGLATN
jgi:hypothetical protein